jgi:hypothetical protein
MKYKVGITLATASVAAFGLVGPGVAGSDFKNKYGDTTASHDCGDGDTIDYAGPLKMWPPNHKLQDVLMSATDGESNPVEGQANETTLAVTVDVLDAVGGDGGPQHDPDVFFPAGSPAATGNPTAEVPFQLRSERSGKGEGRAYDVRADATFDNGTKSCSWTMQVVVPHDMRGGADWK